MLVFVLHVGLGKEPRTSGLMPCPYYMHDEELVCVWVLLLNYQDTMPMFREYGLPQQVFKGWNYDKVHFRTVAPRTMHCT